MYEEIVLGRRSRNARCRLAGDRREAAEDRTGRPIPRRRWLQQRSSLSAKSTLTSCYGRVDKNALNNADNTIINTALTALGYTGPAITYSAVPLTDIMSGLNGSQSINFPGVFNGTIYLGAHYGNGQGGPGNSTTFYRINAMNLDLIGLTLKASSTVTVFARIPAPAVPEPATWAMMLVGFGMTAASLRYVRRGTKVAIA
jgi:hypothetical protein